MFVDNHADHKFTKAYRFTVYPWKGWLELLCLELPFKVGEKEGQAIYLASPSHHLLFVIGSLPHGV